MAKLAASIVAAFASIPLVCVQAQVTGALNPSLAEARQSMSKGELSKAETLLRAELEHSPNFADAHYLLALVLFREQRPAESLVEYTQGAKSRSPAAEELMGVASDYILLKDYGDADRWLNEATKLEPRSAKAWYMLGRTQYNENRIVDAERSFLTCLSIDARDVRAEYNLGLVYENSQRPEKAIEAYQTAIKWQESSSIKDAQPFLDLGMLLRHQGHIEEALLYLLAAEKAGPRNPLVHAEIGLAYEHLNRLDEAVEELKQGLALSPDVEALHFFLGRLYRRTGRADEASKEFAEAAKLSGTKSNDGIPNEEVNP